MVEDRQGSSASIVASIYPWGGVPLECTIDGRPAHIPLVRYTYLSSFRTPLCTHDGLWMLV